MAQPAVEVAPARRVLVWDAPTRIAHWLLVLLIPFSWWAAEVAHRLDWHRWSGYTVVGVIVFRLYWGFVGGETARFSHFLRGPGAMLDYVRGRAAERLGHNPLGALSVVAIIVMLVVQVMLGFFAVDIDGLESGPLSDRVTFDQGRLAARLHHTTFNILLALIALHLAAIVFYAVRRRNLVWPMITGRRSFDGAGMRPAPLWRFLLGLVLAVAAAWVVSKGLRI